jgi:hypothetical protein
MQKRLFLFLLLFLSIVNADEFLSIHQVNSPRGFINQLMSHIDESGKPKTSYFNISTKVKVPDEAKSKNGEWCGDVFRSFKIYIPAGLEKVRITAVAKPNSSYYVLQAFVPDGEEYENSDLPFRVVKMIDSKILFQKRDTKESGWLYLSFIQASNFVYSQFGHINNPTVNILAKYTFAEDMGKFNEWLAKTRFLDNGDPADAFNEAYMKSRYCSTLGQRIPLSGKTDGVLGDSLAPWLKTDDPFVKVSASEKYIPSINTEIRYTVSYEVGDKPIEGIQGISVQANSNVTDTVVGVLFRSQIDECMKVVDTRIESGKEGFFVYSDNGDNWYRDKDNEAIGGENIRYVGYILKKPSESSNVILNARENGKIQITVKTTDSCSGKSRISFVEKIYYVRDGENKIVKTIHTLTKKPSTSGATGTNNSSNNSGYSSTSGGSYHSGSSTNGGSSATNAQQECEANENEWVDGTCKVREANNNSNNTSSSTNGGSSVNNTSDAQRECEAQGNEWVDGTCKVREANGEESSSQSPRLIQIVRKLNKKTLPVKGYFTNYGTGAFDWIYVSGNRIWKLDGLKENGEFKWTELTEYFTQLDIEKYRYIHLGPLKIKNEQSSDTSSQQNVSDSEKKKTDVSQNESSSQNDIGDFPSDNN